jgi:hypothetical protein
MNGGGEIVKIHHLSNCIKLEVREAKVRAVQTIVELAATNYVIRIGDVIYWSDEKKMACWLTKCSDRERDLAMKGYYE